MISRLRTSLRGAITELEQVHSQYSVVHLHIKDGKRDGGANVALGAGDTSIKECLIPLLDNSYPI